MLHYKGEVRVLSFLNRIVITPYQMLFSYKQHILEVLLTLLILYYLSIFFNAISSKEERPIPILYKGHGVESSKINNREGMIKEIIKLKLFSKSEKNSKKNEKINSIEEINNAPLYHGDLKLVGVLKHTDESKSIAIIDSGVEQKTYFIGNAIENKNVFIVKILIDKITVSDGTTYYSLILLE